MKTVLVFLLLLTLFTGSISYIAASSAYSSSDNGRVMKTLYIGEWQDEDKEVRVFGKGTDLEH